MPKTPPIGVRLQPETRARLEREAKDDGRSISSLISHLCDKWVAGRGKKK